MNRINLLYKMDGLLATCKTCDKNGLQQHFEEKCAGCQVYTELKEIGNQLGRKKPVAKLEMTVDEFIKLKHEDKLPVSKIAELKGCSEANIYYWQSNRKGQIDMALGKIKIPQQTPTKTVKEEKKQHQCTCSKEDKSDEYERLIAELKERAKEDKELITRLQTKVEELESLHAACEDVENETADLQNEVSRLREERNQYQDEAGRLMEQNVQTDYQLENWKKLYKNLMEHNAHLEKENRSMREVIKLWA